MVYGWRMRFYAFMYIHGACTAGAHGCFLHACMYIRIDTTHTKSTPPEKKTADPIQDAPDTNHRVLIFAQLKSLLDLVARDVLHPANISYVRLDGTVPPSQRFAMVQQFNSDPTIDVMLLTTHVGGLGLNLTSADTVIFLEHDWNPTKDLQAMDRAHRLGQSRTVNVYRVLTRDTIEERVMGLQRFKLDVAAAVVNADNVSMEAMDTSQLLDLFQVCFVGGGGEMQVGKSKMGK